MRFVVTLRDGGQGRVLVPVPFDPDELWTVKTRHLVGGTINGGQIRGAIERHGGEWALRLSQFWARESGAAAGDEVRVEIEPEGPQRGDLAEDIASALAANPRAGEFFDALAQFYRKAYLRWIDGTKRDPAERARRIARTVELLASGVKDHRKNQA